MAERRETMLVDARTFGSRPTGVGLYACRRLRRDYLGEAEPPRIVLVSDVVESAEIRALAAEGVEVRAFGRRVYNSLAVMAYFRFVRRVIAEVRPTVFWQPNNLQPFRPAGVPRVIVTMHDVFGLEEFSLRYALWHLYYRLSFARTLRYATEIEYNSFETKRLVEARSARAKALDGRVVHPPTDVPPRETISPYLHPRPYFLYLGNIEFRKGADILFEAYRLYRNRRGASAADLLVAGAPRNVPVPGVEGLRALGYVDTAVKFSLLVSALALVAPSRKEGYGMQVAEAAALGVRCIASDLAVFREIPAGGRSLVPPGDAAALAAAMEDMDDQTMKVKPI